MKPIPTQQSPIPHWRSTYYPGLPYFINYNQELIGLTRMLLCQPGLTWVGIKTSVAARLTPTSDSVIQFVYTMSSANR